jgi:hypothetical protein
VCSISHIAALICGERRKLSPRTSVFPLSTAGHHNRSRDCRVESLGVMVVEAQAAMLNSVALAPSSLACTKASMRNGTRPAWDAYEAEVIYAGHPE